MSGKRAGDQEGGAHEYGPDLEQPGHPVVGPEARDQQGHGSDGEKQERLTAGSRRAHAPVIYQYSAGAALTAGGKESVGRVYECEGENLSRHAHLLPPRRSSGGRAVLYR